MSKIIKIVPLLVLLIIINISLAFAAPSFSIDAPATVAQGGTVSIKINFNTDGNTIAGTSFKLVPTSGITLSVPVVGALGSQIGTMSCNIVTSNLLCTISGTSGASGSGTLVTVTGTAVTSGAQTLTLNNLQAQDDLGDSVSVTGPASALTITVTGAGGASPCTVDDWTCSAYPTCPASGSRTRTCTLSDASCTNSDAVKPAETETCTYTSSCTNGAIRACSYYVDDIPDTVEEDPGYVDGTQTCVNGAWGVCGPAEECIVRAATCSSTGVSCPGSGVIAQVVCPTGQTCTNGQCVSTSGTNAEKDTWINFYDQNKGKEWTIALISQAARLLRGIFS